MKKAKVIPLYSSLEVYQQHIARANNNIFKKVFNEIKEQITHEQHQ